MLERDQINKLPRTQVQRTLCGLYFLYKNNDIVYVGKACNIDRRISAHLYIKDRTMQTVDFDEWTWIEYLDEAERSKAEVEYIQELMPKYNRRWTHRLDPETEELLRSLS